jgi:hypothetical protein
LSGERVERRLAAILSADVAGYSRLMGRDEAGTLARLKLHRGELIGAKTAEHKGRLVKTTGDGMLIEFPSVVEVVACAVAIQRGMGERNAAIPQDQAISFRVGINLGDVIATFFPVTKERIFEALGLLDQAIAIDRHYGPALSWAAICHFRLATDGWSEEPETSRQKGIDLARQALQVEENESGILANAALVLGYFGEDIGAMIGLVNRALTLNPSYARGWELSQRPQVLGRSTRCRDRTS